MRRLKKQIGKQTNQIYTPLGVRICICMCVFTYDRQSELNESTIDEIYNAGRIFFKVRVTLPIAYHLRIQAKWARERDRREKKHYASECYKFCLFFFIVCSVCNFKYYNAQNLHSNCSNKCYIHMHKHTHTQMCNGKAPYFKVTLN